jgi:hypothetical protein
MGHIYIYIYVYAFNCGQYLEEVSFAISWKKVIYFGKFSDAAQFRVPENRIQTHGPVSPEAKAKVAQKVEKSLFSSGVELPKLGSHVQPRKRNEFLNFISTVKKRDASPKLPPKVPPQSLTDTASRQLYNQQRSFKGK